MIRPACGLYLYPSIFVDLESSSSWDDSSSLWTLFISVHFCGQNLHPPGMICLACGLYLYPSTFVDFEFFQLLDFVRIQVEKTDVSEYSS